MSIRHFAAGAYGTGGHERLLTVSAHVKFHRCYLLWRLPNPESGRDRFQQTATLNIQGRKPHTAQQFPFRIQGPSASL